MSPRPSSRRPPAPPPEPEPEPRRRLGLAASVAIPLAAFALASAIAGLAGAANLGTALAFGQIAFIAAAAWVLLRR